MRKIIISISLAVFTLICKAETHVLPEWYNSMLTECISAQNILGNKLLYQSDHNIETSTLSRTSNYYSEHYDQLTIHFSKKYPYPDGPSATCHFKLSTKEIESASFTKSGFDTIRKEYYLSSSRKAAFNQMTDKEMEEYITHSSWIEFDYDLTTSTLITNDD